MRSVSVIHAELVEGFYFGDDAVLLAMDTAGVNTVLAAVTQAAQQGSARLEHGPTIHQFVVEQGAADIKFHEGAVVWRLDAALAAEVIGLLTELHEPPSAGHHYVDISTPAKMLVLSRNEYLDKLPAEATFPLPA